MEKQENLKEFADVEQKRLDAEREQRLKDNGYAPFFTIHDGESAILQFSDIAPRENDGKYGTRMVFSVMDTNNVAFDYSVNPRSPLYRELIENISGGHTKLKITRVGEGVDTKYSVVVVE